MQNTFGPLLICSNNTNLVVPFQQIREINRWILNEENHRNSNCFALTIICHGNEKGLLLDKYKKKAWDTELFVGDLSDVKTLVGKPKIIVIQACRGSEYT